MEIGIYEQMQIFTGGDKSMCTNVDIEKCR